MYEAIFMVLAIALMQWVGGTWTILVAGLVLLFCLPGLLVMRGAAPFVSTPFRTVRAMLSLANVQRGDRVEDLGCGDGRLVFEAAKKGAKATGYEFSIPTYLVAKLRSLFKKNATVRYANFWNVDHSKADVIFCYFLQETMQDFKKKIWPTLKPGTRVVSHAFTMNDIPYEKKEGAAVLYVKK